MKKPYNIDVAVLLIFHARPGCFAQVFEQVKKARPSKLFLYQDGAREGNEKDVIGIKKCREIALDIDWECEVHTKFQDKNFGCDPSGYIAQRWAFDNVEKCIVLEDDVVPTQSFFPFCKELLDKYENDERIHMICGMNNLETTDSPYSYLYAQTGSIWGWASWKRAVDTWQPNYDILDNEYDLQKVKDHLKLYKCDVKRRVNVWKISRESGVQHHETLNGTSMFCNSRLNIIPTKNMIINVGNTPEGGTHSTNGNETIPRGLRKIYTMKSFDIEFPLSHPKYVIEDVAFQKKLFRVMGYGHPFVKFWRRIEKTFLIIRHEGLGKLFRKLKMRRIKKI